ncbi:LysR family transcriptional regulator [Pseudonocardia halophobica]|uniref:LysR family transcriptional regulator n=1 Tax=Pseudonocardia halophobica TaxID=29401 RepID=UPI003D8A691C
MEPRAAEYFLAVVEHGGVTRAAQALYLAQPSLSEAIRRLEEELGVVLFERSGRGLVPTPAGRALVEPARRIVADVERARRTVEEVVALRAGELVIAAVPALAVDPLPELAAALRRRLPGVRLVLLDGTAEGVETDLRAGRCEVALTDGPPADRDPLCRHDAGGREIVLVTTGAEELPEPLPRFHLAEVPLVTELGDSWLRAELGEPRTAVECAHRQALWELVAAGAGAALVSRAGAARELPGARTVGLDPPLHRPVVVAHRPGPLSPAVAAFLEVAGLGCGEPQPSAATNACPAGESRRGS